MVRNRMWSSLAKLKSSFKPPAGSGTYTDPEGPTRRVPILPTGPDVIKEHIDSRVLTLFLNRPEASNLLTEDMLRQLTDRIHRADVSADVDAVILTGTSSVFSEGADLDDLYDSALTPKPWKLEATEKFMTLFSRLTIPFICAVNGRASGLAAGIVAASDLAFLNRSSTICFPWASYGQVPQFGLTSTLPALLGYKKAFELLLIAEALDAAEAVDLGLATAVCDDADSTLETAFRAALRLARSPFHATRTTKELLLRSQRERHAHAMAAEALHVGRLARTEDAALLMAPKMREHRQLDIEHTKKLLAWVEGATYRSSHDVPKIEGPTAAAALAAEARRIVEELEAAEASRKLASSAGSTILPGSDVGSGRRDAEKPPAESAGTSSSLQPGDSQGKP